MTVDTHGKALNTGTQSFQEQAGFKIHTNRACKLTKVTKVTAHTGVKAYLYNSSHGALASASYSGNDATFNYDLADNTDYYLLSGYDDATSHNEAYDLASGGYPYNATNINFVNRYTPSAGDTTNLVENIISVTTTTEVNITVTPATLTLSTTTPIVNIRIHAQPLTLGGSLTLSNVEIVGNNISYNADGSITYPLRPQTHGMAGIKTKFPYAEGLYGGYQKQTGRVTNLIPTEKSLVSSKYNVGL